MLRLTFADGLEGDVDVLQRMHGPVYTDARTPDGFSKVAVDGETGTIVWPSGADLAPDVLYERVRTGWPDHDVAARHQGERPMPTASWPAEPVKPDETVGAGI